MKWAKRGVILALFGGTLAWFWFRRHGIHLPEDPVQLNNDEAEFRA